MRDYARVAPQFWTGPTGRQIRGIADEITRLRARDLAIYLMTCPSANMIGLYYIPLPTIAHERGCTSEGTSEALQRLEQLGFCIYDGSTDFVWVQEMARFQIGEGLKRQDNLVIGVMNLLHEARKSRLAWPFHRYYRERFNLPDAAWLITPSEAPYSPTASPSGEQSKSTEQEHRATTTTPTGDTAPPVASGGSTTKKVGRQRRNGGAEKPPHPVSDPIVRDAVKCWAELFEKHRGEKPVIADGDWPRFCAQAAPVVRRVGIEETRVLLERMFTSTQLKVTNSNYSVRFFADEVNRWRGRRAEVVTAKTAGNVDAARQFVERMEAQRDA